MATLVRRFPSTTVAVALALSVLLAAAFWHINVVHVGLDFIGIEQSEVGEVLLSFVLIIPALFMDRAAARRRRYEAQAVTERLRGLDTSRRLAAIVESSDDAIISKDLDGTITTWNVGAERLFGYTAAEMVGASVMTLIPAERQTEETEILESIRRGVAVRHLETVRRTKGGRLINVSITSSPVKDATGRIVGASKSARDIGELKRAEAGLRRERDRYRTLFEHAADGIVIVDIDGIYVDVNASLCAMLGYTRDELVGAQASKLVAPKDLPNVGSTRKALDETASFRREWDLQRKDGTILPTDILSTLMPDGNLMSVIRDVSDRNRAVDALREAEERMRFALQSADIGIWDMDYATGRLIWSATIEAQYGLQPGTFDGTFESFIERVHPDDRAAVMETVGRAMTSGEDFTTMHRAVWPDGTVHWISGAGQVHLGEHGEAVRGVGIAQDVTARRTLEEQFQQAQKMEAIGRLAGGVAHDFNNLLTAILGYSQLVLSDDRLDSSLRDDIREIEKAGNRAAGLTRQLLAFSRKQIIELRLLDLNAVVADMRSMIERLIGEDLKVVLHLAPDLPRIKADHGQVEQVLLNLAVNARDAMPQGGTLTLETLALELDEHYVAKHFSAKPGRHAALIVTDTGTGMTPAVQARLFEPFFTTKEAGKGTGLGLATVHGIVARCGGSVSVYSELGQGTSFKVYFPAADASERVEAPHAAGPAVTHAQAATLTVLVVEDAEGLRMLAKRLLERQGYKVLLAANANEALHVFEKNASIDILLTDVVMPGASGPELTRQVLAERPSLKVIYMSGYTEDAIVQHGVLKPGIVFLNKPFTAATLAEKFQDVLSR